MSASTPRAGSPAGRAGRPDAVVAVVFRAGRVLVVRRGPAARRPGYWAPVAGRVEPGEGQADAVVREVREEVGLAVTPRGKVWECDTDDGSFRLHWWLAEAGAGDLTCAPGEVSQARWIPPERFGDLRPTFADDRRFFAEVLPGLDVRGLQAADEGERDLLDG